jgi:hypothetical protein
MHYNRCPSAAVPRHLVEFSVETADLWGDECKC